jgi:hypothetical protein
LKLHEKTHLDEQTATATSTANSINFNSIL